MKKLVGPYYVNYFSASLAIKVLILLFKRSRKPVLAIDLKAIKWLNGSLLLRVINFCSFDLINAIE